MNLYKKTSKQTIQDNIKLIRIQDNLIMEKFNKHEIYTLITIQHNTKGKICFKRKINNTRLKTLKIKNINSKYKTIIEQIE